MIFVLFFEFLKCCLLKLQAPNRRNVLLGKSFYCRVNLSKWIINQVNALDPFLFCNVHVWHSCKSCTLVCFVSLNISLVCLDALLWFSFNKQYICLQGILSAPAMSKKHHPVIEIVELVIGDMFRLFVNISFSLQSFSLYVGVLFLIFFTSFCMRVRG